MKQIEEEDSTTIMRNFLFRGLEVKFTHRTDDDIMSTHYALSGESEDVINYIADLDPITTLAETLAADTFPLYGVEIQSGVSEFAANISQIRDVITRYNIPRSDWFWRRTYYPSRVHFIFPDSSLSTELKLTLTAAEIITYNTVAEFNGVFVHVA